MNSLVTMSLGSFTSFWRFFDQNRRCLAKKEIVRAARGLREVVIREVARRVRLCTEYCYAGIGTRVGIEVEADHCYVKLMCVRLWPRIKMRWIWRGKCAFDVDIDCLVHVILSLTRVDYSNFDKKFDQRLAYGSNHGFVTRQNLFLKLWKVISKIKLALQRCRVMFRNGFLRIWPKCVENKFWIVWCDSSFCTSV